MKSRQLSSWLNHPKVKPVRESVIARLKAHPGYFRHLGAVVFLCGGKGSSRRDYLARYLRDNSKANVFYAEDVWRMVSSQRPQGNALEMEGELARLADVVALIVESPGTFCELGAFAHSEALRRKLLVVLDREFQGDESFIETGPVRWVNKDSDFAPALWVDMKRILMYAGDIGERIGRIRSSGARGGKGILGDTKMTLVFLVDLATIFGPCTIGDLEILTEAVLGRSRQEVPYSMLLGLAVALGLLCERAGCYVRPLGKGDFIPYHRPSKSLNVLDMRAAIVGVRQRLGSAWPVGQWH